MYNQDFEFKKKQQINERTKVSSASKSLHWMNKRKNYLKMPILSDIGN